MSICSIKINKAIANLEHYGSKEFDGEYMTGNASIKIKHDTIYVDIKAGCVPQPYSWCCAMKRDDAVCVTLDIPDVSEYLGEYCINPNWIRPVFGKCISEFDQEAQFLLLHCEDKYVFVLPVTNDRFHTTIKIDDGKMKLCVNMLFSGETEIEGTIAVITEANNPYEAIHKGFDMVCSKLILTPGKNKKDYPEILNKLGWCSWDAFKHDISEDKLIAKLEELKTKNIPVKWILIDDGWSETENWYLKSFVEDKVKFPNGLKHTISRMKNEYGIEKVGIWHSMTGYWYGIDFECIEATESWQNRKIPSGYDFYAKWYKYLKEQGVDFLKVDTQGNLTEYVFNQKNALKTIRNTFEGLEKSAAEHFDFMINCMGMKSTNSFQHRNSVLMRNSDDFYPEKMDGFYNHAVDNIYNAVFQDEMFYCDYDMWWSKHLAAKQNSVLRFLSGGPVYMSDALGESDDTYIRMFCDENGRFDRPDMALKPTYDCLFGFEKVLKAFTKLNGEYVIVAFTFEENADFNISSEDFGKSGDYIVKEFFTGKETSIKAGEKIRVTMLADDVAIYHFAKI